jgi:hypothetical protein
MSDTIFGMAYGQCTQCCCLFDRGCMLAKQRRAFAGGDLAATHLCPWCYKLTYRARSACSYCGRPCFATKDHVVPRHRGGQMTLDACRECNTAKGSLSLAEWLKTLPADAPQHERAAEIFRVYPEVGGDQTRSMKKKKTKKSLP